MPYKLVIFDFDGTLADSFPYFLRTVNVLAETYDFPRIETDQVDTLRGLDARQLMKQSSIPAWKVPLIANAFMRLMTQDIDQIQLFAGVPELLHTLADRGIQLAIVSTNSEQNVRRVLGPELASRVAHYACGTALFGKSRKFSRVVARSGWTVGETLSVGDEVRDAEAARQVGMAFGAVAWGYARPDVLAALPGVTFFYTVDEIQNAVLGN